MKCHEMKRTRTALTANVKYRGDCIASKKHKNWHKYYADECLQKSARVR